MKRVPFVNDIYVISDSVDVLRNAVDAGAAIVQLRDKISRESIVLDKARNLAGYKKIRRFLFILNDDPYLAVKAGVDGVHIGQDTSTLETRNIIGEGMILGKTTHNMEQARQAMEDHVDYISVGPVYATPTKPERQAVGLDYVRKAAANVAIPFVAIGGIDLSNIDEVLSAGARTIGIVRAYGSAGEMLCKIRGRSL